MQKRTVNANRYEWTDDEWIGKNKAEPNRVPRQYGSTKGFGMKRRVHTRAGTPLFFFKKQPILGEEKEKQAETVNWD